MLLYFDIENFASLVALFATILVSANLLYYTSLILEISLDKLNKKSI